VVAHQAWKKITSVVYGSYPYSPKKRRSGALRPRTAPKAAHSGGALHPVADPDAVQAEELAQLGLTTYEARTYLALLRRESSTAAEAARLANVPRQRIYDVLAGLVDRGLVAMRPGQVTKYAADAPEHALERLVSDQREQVAELEQRAALLVEVLGPAFDAGRDESRSLEYIDVLHDRRAIDERFHELQAASTHEILVFTKTALHELELRRGADVRGVYELAAIGNREIVKGVRGLVDAGGGARFVSELPLDLMIVDESIVMFGMEDPVAGTTEQTMMVVEHPALAGLLKIAFNTTWEQGLTLTEARAWALQDANARPWD
jgi:HTH-type transcriptional regulator, sugar sensing transcriptional regulator